VARLRPAAAAMSSACGRGNAVKLTSILNQRKFLLFSLRLLRGTEGKYCDDRVCLSVSARVSQKPCVQTPAVLQYVMHFRFPE